MVALLERLALAESPSSMPERQEEVLAILVGELSGSGYRVHSVREGGAAAFSAMGATRESIVEAAKEDYAEFIRDRSVVGPPGAPERLISRRSSSTRARRGYIRTT